MKGAICKDTRFWNAGRRSHGDDWVLSQRRDRLATYAKPEHNRESFSKVWEITEGSRVGPIKLKSFNILGLKQHHSLWALIRGQTEDSDLVIHPLYS